MIRRDDRLVEEELLILDATEVLWELRDRLGITWQEVADALDVTPPTVSQAVSGNENLTLRRVARLAFAMGYRIKLVAEPLQKRAR